MSTRTSGLQSIPVYLGAFGIGWVVVIVLHASRNVHAAYADLRPCFLNDDVEYHAILTKWFRRMTDKTQTLAVCAFFTLAVWLIVYMAFFHYPVLQAWHMGSLRPWVFPAAWYTPRHLSLKAGIVGYYAIFAVPLLATAFRLLYLNTFFLLDLRHLDVIPVGNIVRTRLKAVANFYLVVSLAWFLGVFLFVVMFIENLDLFSVGLIAALMLLGTVNFFTPQVIFRRYLSSSYRVVCDAGLMALTRSLGIKLEEGTRTSTVLSTRADFLNLSDLASIINATTPPKMWVYDGEDFLVLLFGQSLVWVSLTYQSVLSTWLSHHPPPGLG